MSISKLLALIFGVTFVSVGLIGFLPNPLVSAEGLFVTNTMHNLVHVLTGGAFLLAALMPGRESTLILGIGAAYVAVAALGFLTRGDQLLGIVHINQADRWLHAFLAAAILLAGRIAKQMDLSRSLEAD
ncbi:MAG: DUF4383 domain-containing protein [Gammaproteobacteria bacterium]